MKRRPKNPYDEDSITLLEIGSGEGERGLSELRLGSGLPCSSAEILQVISHAFSGGQAFTREQLAHELAGQRGCSGMKLRASAASSEVGKSIRRMLDEKIVIPAGREFTKDGREGAERFLLTQAGAEKALGDRLLKSDDYVERALDSEIARYEREDAHAAKEARPRKSREITYVAPHAAAGKRPCTLCRIKHRLGAHRSHRVDAPRLTRNPMKKKRGKR